MMAANYRFRLWVELPRSYERLCVSFEVEANLAEPFQPYDHCSDSVTAWITDGVTNIGAQRIDADREKLAADISKKLTTAIIKAIAAHDLKNGYKQEDKINELTRP